MPFKKDDAILRLKAHDMTVQGLLGNIELLCSSRNIKLFCHS